MNRRKALMALGSGAISSVAGCSSEGDSETVATPPLEEIILWSNLETGGDTVNVQITVEKDGSRVFETVHGFEGETRFNIVENWLGDAVPYSITIAPTVHDGATTYSSSDLRRPDSIDCWSLYGEFDSSSIFVSPLTGGETC